jgi:hypothetical protein
VLAGLIIALFIVAAALLVATVGSLGVAVIGSLLHRWFDLTQWQGSLIALAVALCVGLIAYRLAATPEVHEPQWIEWDDEEDEDDAPEESPIPAWRARRPTQAKLPSTRPPQKGSRRK